MRKFYLSIFLIILSFNISCQNKEKEILDKKKIQEQRFRDGRVLIEIPFEDRVSHLKAMRSNFMVITEMLNQLQQSNYDKVIEQAESLLYDEKRQERMEKSGNKGFALIGANIHAEGVPNIIKAAKSKNKSKTLKSIVTVMQACSYCHTAYRYSEWPITYDYKQPPFVKAKKALIKETKGRN